MKKCLVIVMSILFVYAGNVFALGAGGYRNEVVDAEASGKGYCFTAQADGPSAVHYNPAGLTQLKGSYISTGYMMEAPRFECDSAATGDTVQMQKQLFWLPHVYFVSDFKSEDFRFGFGANSPYGLSTDWAGDSFTRYISEESDVKMVNFNPVVAYKVNDYLSVGAGVDYFTANISKHRRIFDTLSDNDGDFQLKGNDEAWGYNVALLVKPSERHSIGLSYRSEIDLTYKGTVTLDNLNPTGLAIFGGTAYSTAMESDSTIPRSLALGYAYKPNDRWTIETDVEWTDWSCVEEEFIKFPDLTDATDPTGLRRASLNAGNPASRDWHDGYAYGIGAEYKTTDNLDLRCGFLYETSPIPTVNWEPVLPDANKYGLTFGLGYLFKDFKIDASYSFFKYKDRYITNDAGSATSTTINADGTYKGYANIAGVTVTYMY